MTADAASGLTSSDSGVIVFVNLAMLSAFAEDHGRKSMDECGRGTLRSSESEGGCFGGLRRRNEGYHGRKPVEASLD